MSGDFQGTERHDGMAVQPALVDDQPADRHHRALRSHGHPVAYRIGLFVLIVGLAVTVFAVATWISSIVQAVLLAAPLALIGIGLERIGRGEGKASLRVVGLSLLMVAVLGTAVVSLYSPNRLVVDRLSAPVPSGTDQAQLRATPGSGQLRVRSTADDLYTADLSGPGRSTAQVTAADTRALLDLRAPVPRGVFARNRGSDWVVSLGTALPWQIDVQAGTLNADLNLRGLDVRGVRVDSGVSRLVVSLGQPTAQVPVRLQASSGLVDIYLPRTAACEIRVEGVSVDNLRREGLVKEHGTWRTSNADQANRYVVEVRISGGRVQLHRG